jgi:hypothetical protein
MRCILSNDKLEEGQVNDFTEKKRKKSIHIVLYSYWNQIVYSKQILRLCNSILDRSYHITLPEAIWFDRIYN